jgi:hypothetical protein
MTTALPRPPVVSNRITPNLCSAYLLEAYYRTLPRNRNAAARAVAIDRTAFSIVSISFFRFKFPLATLKHPRNGLPVLADREQS